jgi:hypothetical protein
MYRICRDALPPGLRSRKSKSGFGGAITIHLEDVVEDGLLIPEPSSRVEYVEMA